MPNSAPMFNARKQGKSNWSKWQARKGNRHKRGYGWSWQKIRKRIIERDKNLCQTCFRKGKLTEAEAVDHIVPKSHGGGDRESNLECICDPCHKAKTARERSE